MKKNGKITRKTKHEQLTEILRKELDSGKKSGEKFPTVREIMNTYGVSQATVSKALEPLFHEGLIYSVSGKGIFITSRNSEEKISKSHNTIVNYIVSDTEIFDQISNPGNWFVCKGIMEGVTETAFSMGYKINIIPVETNNIDLEYFDALAKIPGSMFVFSLYKPYEALIQHCIKNHIPYSVYTWHIPSSRKINQVWVDINDSSYEITTHLISLGHKNIAFMGGDQDSIRYRGYIRALRDNNIPRNPAYEAFCLEGTVESTREIFSRILEGCPEITAVSCSSDLRAIGVMEAGKEKGLSIPEDISVAGIDDISGFYPTSPPLTTLWLPRKEIGTSLVQLADKIRKSNAFTPEIEKLTTRLIIRKSCRKLS